MLKTAQGDKAGSGETPCEDWMTTQGRDDGAQVWAAEVVRHGQTLNRF